MDFTALQTEYENAKILIANAKTVIQSLQKTAATQNQSIATQAQTIATHVHTINTQAQTIAGHVAALAANKVNEDAFNNIVESLKSELAGFTNFLSPDNLANNLIAAQAAVINAVTDAANTVETVVPELATTVTSVVQEVTPAVVTTANTVSNGSILTELELETEVKNIVDRVEGVANTVSTEVANNTIVKNVEEESNKIVEGVKTLVEKVVTTPVLDTVDDIDMLFQKIMNKGTTSVVAANVTVPEQVQNIITQAAAFNN